MTLIELYLLFVKYGFLCFGGGYALVPLMLRDLTGEHYHALTPETFGALVSIAQITPGAIGLNIATFTGMLQGGVPAALLASIGLLTSSLILIPLLVRTMCRWEHARWMRGFMAGIRPASLALILCAGVLFLYMSALNDESPTQIHPLGTVIVIASAIAFYYKVSPVLLILSGAALGALYALL